MTKGAMTSILAVALGVEDAELDKAIWVLVWAVEPAATHLESALSRHRERVCDLGFLELLFGEYVVCFCEGD